MLPLLITLSLRRVLLMSTAVPSLPVPVRVPLL
jgi:hypothetical protein